MNSTFISNSFIATKIYLDKSIYPRYGIPISDIAYLRRHFSVVDAWFMLPQEKVVFQYHRLTSAVRDTQLERLFNSGKT
jgi:hypothetical protein